MDYTVHGILQARILEWVAVSFPGDLPRSPTLQADSPPAEPPGQIRNNTLKRIWGRGNCYKLLYFKIVLNHIF